MRNPLAEAIKEGLRRQGGNQQGKQSTRSLAQGNGLPGAGLPSGSSGTINLTPNGRFRIGISKIGGTDKIG